MKVLITKKYNMSGKKKYDEEKLKIKRTERIK